MKAALLLNSSAGHGEARQEELVGLAKEADVHVLESNSPDDIDDLLGRAVNERFERLVVAGGDGTIHTVINAMAPDFSQIELGLIPCGTGNDLARSLNLVDLTVARAFELSTSAPARPIDLARIESEGECRHAVNLIWCGFGDSEQHAQQTDFKKWFGSAAYWTRTAGTLLNMPTFSLELKIEDRNLQIDAQGLVIANGRYVGGGILAAPDAQIDDGLLDILVFPEQPIAQTLLAGFEVITGAASESERVVSLRGRRVTLQIGEAKSLHPDGEKLSPSRKATVEVLPGALRIARGTTK